MIADVAFTLLDPTASKDDEKLQKEADDEPMLAVADKRIKDKTVPTKFKEHGFVQQLIYSLKDNGTAIIFLGKGPLHREIEKSARTFLIDNNFVDAVIELPPRLIKPRTVSLYALVLKKGRNNDIVKFINASDCYEAVGRVNKLAKLDDIYELYNSKSSVSSRMVLKEVNQVVANDYLLIPSSYLSDFKTTSNSIDLKEIRVQLFNQAKDTDKKLETIFTQLHK
jgi:type I restriction enzyme M protein